MTHSFSITGMLICYSERAEMDRIRASLKQLQSKPGMKDVFISRAYNPNDVPYPWTIGLLVLEAATLTRLDDYLVTSNTDLGDDKEIYSGEARAREFFLMLPLDGKYEPGIVKIRTGTCPRKAVSMSACSLCPAGHMLECHYPDTCEKAQCSHLSKYDGF